MDELTKATFQYVAGYLISKCPNFRFETVGYGQPLLMLSGKRVRPDILVLEVWSDSYVFSKAYGNAKLGRICIADGLIIISGDVLGNNRYSLCDAESCKMLADLINEKQEAVKAHFKRFDVKLLRHDQKQELY